MADSELTNAAIAASRTTGIDVETLGLTLNTLHDALPQAIQDKIALDDDFDQLIAGIADSPLPQPVSSNNNEFPIWVVDAGIPSRQHYVTIILHSATSSDPTAKPNILGVVDEAAVIDPLQHTGATYYKKDRAQWSLRRLLGDTAAFADENQNPWRTVWVPPQEPEDRFSSGFRAFSIVAQFFDRVGAYHASGKEFGRVGFWAPTRPWFNVYLVRGEMLGLVAAKALAETGWKTRLVLSLVAPSAGASGRGALPTSESEQGNESRPSKWDEDRYDRTKDYREKMQEHIGWAMGSVEEAERRATEALEVADRIHGKMLDRSFEWPADSPEGIETVEDQLADAQKNILQEIQKIAAARAEELLQTDQQEAEKGKGESKKRAGSENSRASEKKRKALEHEKGLVLPSQEEEPPQDEELHEDATQKPIATADAGTQTMRVPREDVGEQTIARWLESTQQGSVNDWEEDGTQPEKAPEFPDDLADMDEEGIEGFAELLDKGAKVPADYSSKLYGSVLLDCLGESIRHESPRLFQVLVDHGAVHSKRLARSLRRMAKEEEDEYMAHMLEKYL
ncbi:Uu.00g098810.m01.CDS01 [Anthostomella pinea]|uniref:Uu.00g098810.m01.CDS01 n=1 Tax=Anthostomella pinea TaxID=933095 RepID=A0AAI8YF65_9PEZI|nr:Uu.00g098810.m01.CDS01 [Anthostomella pinea]